MYILGVVKRLQRVCNKLYSQILAIIKTKKKKIEYSGIILLMI